MSFCWKTIYDPILGWKAKAHVIIPTVSHTQCISENYLYRSYAKVEMTFKVTVQGSSLLSINFTSSEQEVDIYVKLQSHDWSYSNGKRQCQ